MHIVDTLIEERAEKLMRHSFVWKLIKAALYPAFRYKDAKHLADTVDKMTGAEIFALLSQQLSLDVKVDGLEHVPRTGRAIVVANHPAGIVDGIAVYDALREVRDDLVFLANGDAVRVAGGLTDMLIPIEWRPELRTHGQARQVAKLIALAFRQQRLVVIYPSGRIAHLTAQGLRERPWQPTAISLSRRYQCPLVPLNIRARNSWLFYLFAMFNTELRDMTLFRELFNKQGQSYRLTFGELIEEDDDSALDLDALQRYVEQDLRAGRPWLPIASPLTG